MSSELNVTDPGRPRSIRIGSAGWSLPASAAHLFPTSGSHLERYSQRLNAAEVNSSFYRSHKPATYARWAASVPDDFAFSVKLPKVITHESRLLNSAHALDTFLHEVRHLGTRLRCLLVQLPPKLVFDETVARAFFAQLREGYEGAVAVEPRHESWFTAAPNELLRSMRCARVAADPGKPEGAGFPGGHSDLAYYRLHGSPRMYYSRYDTAYLERLADRLSSGPAHECWCIFDNTASGSAARNAIELTDFLHAERKAS